MLDNESINRLSDRINQLLPPQLQQVKSDFDSRLKALLQQQLSELEFVNREEFDIQTRVLQKTRAKLETLQTRLDELEQKLDQ
ncbi:MAG: accessory factor UbiK family protein [Gammaproteobacteria bacterium]|nr:accessory factor UbiK family protein [Gammaproteobacteria bacterium]